MKKNGLMIGIAALAMAALVACGSSSGSSSGNATTAAAGSSAAANTTAADKTEAASDTTAAVANTSDVKLPKNIEVQVPAKAGGGTDVMARTLGQGIASESGSNVTIVNNTDGSGVVAMETVRNGKGDGSELLQFHTTMLIKTATNIYKYSAADDFKVIGVAQGIEKGLYVLVTASDDLDTMEKFLAAGKSGEIKMGIESGGTTHVLTGLLAKAADIKVKYVEAGSDTEKLTALVGNTIDACLVNTNQAKQYVESGKAHALAVVTNGEEGAKSSVLPDVPSMQDEGVDFSFTTLNLILGPKSMDDATAKALYDYYNTAAESDAVNEVLEPAGMAMHFFPYEEGISKIKEQQEAINSVVDELGIKK